MNKELRISGLTLGLLYCVEKGLPARLAATKAEAADTHRRSMVNENATARLWSNTTNSSMNLIRRVVDTRLVET